MNSVLPLLVAFLFTKCLVCEHACVPVCLSVSVSVYGQTHTGYTSGDSDFIYTKPGFCY